RPHPRRGQPTTGEDPLGATDRGDGRALARARSTRRRVRRAQASSGGTECCSTATADTARIRPRCGRSFGEGRSGPVSTTTRVTTARATTAADRLTPRTSTGSHRPDRATQRHGTGQRDRPGVTAREDLAEHLDGGPPELGEGRGHG